MKHFLILFLSSFLITILITVPFARHLALYLNIVDVPDFFLKRHSKVTPYLGGAAIFVSFWVILSLFLGIYHCNLFGLLIGSSLICIAGLIDDILVLSPFQKLKFQLLAATILVIFGFSLDFHSPFYLNKALSLFWIVALMNAFNLVDVMDGLATIIGIGIGCGLLGYAFYLKQDLLASMLLILLGAQLGFFYHNRPRATIYLGDAGSMLIGTILAVISLKINWICLGEKNFLNYLIAPIIFGIPLIEVISLILIRKFKKIPFYNGSPDHYIHYLKNKGWCEWSILRYTLAYCGLLSLFSLCVAFSKNQLALLLCFGILLQGLWIYVVFAKNS